MRTRVRTLANHLPCSGGGRLPIAFDAQPFVLDERINDVGTSIFFHPKANNANYVMLAEVLFRNVFELFLKEVLDRF